jgi:hypothetical protein
MTFSSANHRHKIDGCAKTIGRSRFWHNGNRELLDGIRRISTMSEKESKAAQRGEA